PWGRPWSGRESAGFPRHASVTCLLRHASCNTPPATCHCRLFADRSTIIGNTRWLTDMRDGFLPWVHPTDCRRAGQMTDVAEVTGTAVSGAGQHSGPPAVVVRGLAKRYGQIEAVRGIDFDVRPGETFGFLGPNGAGKSTTIKI